MGILYNVPDLKTWGIMFFILVVLIALNELGRETKWGGILLFVIVPVVLTIFVWPTTCAPGNEYGTGNWFRVFFLTLRRIIQEIYLWMI
mgnify:FL=1